MLRSAVLYRDDAVIVIDKPAGLAVQGGTGTEQHLDALLDALRFDAAERPRLVHRLDKDTSGVLVLARSAGGRGGAGRGVSRQDRAQGLLGARRSACRSRARGGSTCRWPSCTGSGGERVVADDEDGKRAVTFYRTVAHAGEQDRLARARAGDRAHPSAARACGGDRHADPGRRQIWRRRGASRRRAATRGSCISMPAPSSSRIPAASGLP